MVSGYNTPATGIMGVVKMNIIIQAVLILVYGTLMGFIFMGIERKVMARIQRRIGPPVYQPLLDTLKLLGKKESITHGLSALQLKRGLNSRRIPPGGSNAWNNAWCNELGKPVFRARCSERSLDHGGNAASIWSGHYCSG